MANPPINVIFVPGNDFDRPGERWRPYLAYELSKRGLGVINVQFPDAELARKEYWLAYLEQLGADENTILIGHSSGAAAALRYAENHPLLGTVLIGAAYTDLGDEKDKESGYFEDKWQWQTIKNNQEWIIQFASTDDPYIPIDEMRHIREQLNTEYHEFEDRGHFATGDEFPELVESIKEKV